MIFRKSYFKPISYRYLTYINPILLLTDTDTDIAFSFYFEPIPIPSMFETYRYRYRYQVSISVWVYRLLPGIGRSLLPQLLHTCSSKHTYINVHPMVMFTPSKKKYFLLSAFLFFYEKFFLHLIAKYENCKIKYNILNIIQHVTHSMHGL